MNIGPALGILIIANNFIHDLATALLFASGAALWAIGRKYEAHSRKGDRAVTEYFVGLFRSMAGLARLSLLFIVVCGVPRTIFFRDFEWTAAVEHGQAIALAAKNMLAFVLVAAGVRLWIRLRRRVREAEATLGR